MDEKIIMSKFDEIISKIAELNDSDDDDKKMSALCEENESLKKEIAELQAKLDKMTGEKNEVDAKNTELNSQVDELKSEKTKAENAQLVSELNSELARFTEDQKKVASDQIKAFAENPVKSEINSIVATIKCAVADKVMADAMAMSEQNSFDGFGKFKSGLDSIFGAVDEPNDTADNNGSMF